MVYQGLDFGIIMGRVLILYTKGLRYFRNIWDVGRNDILRFTMTFGLSCWNFTDPSMVERLDKVLTLLHVNGLVCIETQRMHYLNGWSLLVTSRNLAYEHVHFSAKFMSTFLKSTVGSQYFTLTKVQSNTKNATPPMIFSWWTSHVRVDRLTRGSGHTQYNLFFGKLNQLILDLARWWWLEVAPFFAYSAKMGRKWITT